MVDLWGDFFEILVVDEAHICSSLDTQVGQAIRNYWLGPKLFISATPMKNTTEAFASILVQMGEPQWQDQRVCLKDLNETQANRYRQLLNEHYMIANDYTTMKGRIPPVMECILWIRMPPPLQAAFEHSDYIDLLTKSAEKLDAHRRAPASRKVLEAQVVKDLNKRVLEGLALVQKAMISYKLFESGLKAAADKKIGTGKEQQSQHAQTMKIGLLNDWRRATLSLLQAKVTVSTLLFNRRLLISVVWFSSTQWNY